MEPLNDVVGKDIIIDCTNLEYISSAGLRVFLGILQNSEEKGGHVYIKNINAKVHTIFAITGVLDANEALSGFSSSTVAIVGAMGIMVAGQKRPHRRHPRHLFHLPLYDTIK